MSDKRSVYGHCQLEPSRIVSRVMIGLSAIFFTLAGSAAVWAQLSVVSSSKIQGVVRDLTPGEMTIVDTEGVAHSVKIQNKGEAFIVLGKNRVRFPVPVRSPHKCRIDRYIRPIACSKQIRVCQASHYPIQFYLARI